VNVETDQALIRSARQSDLEAILALARSCDLLQEGIAEAVEHFSLATAGGRLIGVCGLEAYDDVGLLRTLGVEPAHRRRGLGQRLVETTLRRGGVEGLRTIYLLTTTAWEFFAHLGFEDAPRAAAPNAIQKSWEFASGCPSSARLMFRPTHR
jgi:amino-acid N-acetyltransferase